MSGCNERALGSFKSPSPSLLISRPLSSGYYPGIHVGESSVKTITEQRLSLRVGIDLVLFCVRPGNATMPTSNTAGWQGGSGDVDLHAEGREYRKLEFEWEFGEI